MVSAEDKARRLPEVGRIALRRPAGLWRIMRFLTLYLIAWTVLHLLAGTLEISPGASAFYPNAGVNLAVMVLAGPAWWPIAAIGPIVFASFDAVDNAPLSVLAGGLIPAAGYGLAARAIRARLRAATGESDLRRLLTVMPIAWAGGAGIAAVNMVHYWLAGIVGRDEFVTAFFGFWIGDAVGIAVATPLILLVHERLAGKPLRALPAGLARQARRMLNRRAAGLFAGYGLLVALAVVNFEESAVLWLAIYPLLILSAFHLEGPIATALAAAVLSIALVLLHQWVGSDISPVLLQCFLLSSVFSALICASAVHDIRRRKKLEAELLSANHAATAAAKAKDAFLAAMSHELRTPLNAILGFSEVMRDDAGGRVDPAKCREYANDIHESGRHLLSIINDLLDLAKIEAGRFDLRPEPLAVASEIALCTRLVGAKLEARELTLVRDVPAGLPPLTADRRAVRQMLFNLLSNAINYSAPGDRICVSARAEPGGGLRIVVADTGIGIPPEDQARLFRPFERAGDPAQRRAGGTGLGLALVKSMIEEHGGRIHLASRKGEGSTFTLVFPPG